jgi:hypothetical protein
MSIENIINQHIEQYIEKISLHYDIPKEELISLFYQYSEITTELSNKVPTLPRKTDKTNCEIKTILKQLLDSSRPTKQHTDNILKLSSLKEAHMYCKYNNLSGQQTGPLIEKYIKVKYGMEKNKSSICEGDLKHKGVNIEIKVSNGGSSNNKFNFVQIRVNHNCNYIFSAYYIHYDNLDNLGELFIFRIDKETIRYLILNYGQYAHGTVTKLGEITVEDLKDTNSQKEYCLRPTYSDKCWRELLRFRVNEINI